MAARSAPQGNKDTPRRTVNRDNAEQATQARQSGQDGGHSRLAENVPSEKRVPEQGYADYAQNYDEDDAALNDRIPDVFLDSQVVNLNGFNFEVDDLRAKVALFTIYLSELRRERWTLLAMVLSILGIGLLLSYYGLSTYAIPVLGKAYLDGVQNAVVLANTILLDGLTRSVLYVAFLLYSAGFILFGFGVWSS